MDLGFGKANQVLGEATAKALLQSSQAQERVIDDELQRMDAVLDDEAALQQLREKRLEQLKKAQRQREEWKQQGHGVYTELLQAQEDVAKEFFRACKQSERLVVHFYRPTTRACDVLHAHLEKLAPRHVETRFVKLNVEACHEGNNGVAFLVERLGIRVMPTLVIVKDGKVVHHMLGFDEVGGSDDFDTNTLAYVLGRHEAITAREDEVPPERDLQNASSVNAIRIHKSSVREAFHSKYHDNDE